MLRTPHSKLFVAYHRPYALADVRAAIADLAKLIHEAPDAIRQKIRELVPEYDTPHTPEPHSSAAENATGAARLPQRHTNHAPAITTSTAHD